MGYIKTLKEAEQHLTNRESFNAGSLTARWEELLGGGSVYVVRSYETIIADYEESGRRFIKSNAYFHSKTTSKHANIVKRAWGLN